MRKLVSQMHISLDGYTAGPQGEMDWIKVDDEIFEMANTFTDNADTALYGRVTWQMMDAYWPTAADQPNATRHDRDHSVWYNKVQKFVLSNTMQGQKATKTTFIGSDLAEAVKKLKETIGKNIMMFGSPGAVRSLMSLHLIDDYWLFVNPIILGKGISMFAPLDTKLPLTLKTTKTFKCGVTALHYTSNQ